jgi:hypothetical protein
LNQLASAGLFAASLLGTLLFGEFAVRLFVNPGDFLVAARRPDPVLDYRVEPGVGGHDAWGFRNPAVPETADVVVVGDSLTYGFGAPADDSWPAALARLTDRSVYNLGHGGYGPLQYRHLVEERALALAPSDVVVGLYLGNDLLNAYVVAYSLEHWSGLRDPERPELEVLASARGQGVARPFVRPAEKRGLVQWLRSHSVLAGMAWKALHGGRDAPPRGRAVLDSRGEILTRVDVSQGLATLDLEDPRVAEGLRLTLDALEVMAAACRARGVRLVVVLIPSKASVFREALLRTPDTEVVERVTANERTVADAIRTRLDAAGIAHVDVLPDLRAAATRSGLYPRSANQHPTGEGYRVIAEGVARSFASPVP